MSQPGPLALDPCNRALTEESLSQRDRAATLVNRGIIRMRLGRFNDAIEDYRAAIRLKSDLGDSYINLRPCPRPHQAGRSSTGGVEPGPEPQPVQCVRRLLHPRHGP
ncbi:tetratricopeptide repeat protein [Paenibacillus sp. DMB20]|uniref:tetratricopeptide repeat protein n=1 Tax=Paenibacillus sp. DMB20 TaxID=1642570 RepID=UPI003FA59745